MNAFTFADMFSGCGGFSHGFHRDGFQHLLAVDAWDASLKTYQANFSGTDVECADLSDPGVRHNLAIRLRDRVDVMLGGPPCQGFSTLGKRRDGDHRSTLVDAFASLCVDVRPKVVIVENVRGITTKKHPSGRSYADALLAALTNNKKCEYVCEARVLNAMDFGLAQTRVRWFLVGIRRDLPDAADLLSLLWRRIERRRRTKSGVLRDAIGDLPTIGPGEGGEILRSSNGETEIYNHRAMGHSALLVERLASVPAGGGLPDVPPRLLTPHLKRMLDGEYGSGGHVKNVYGRMEWDKPSGTIVAGIDKITCGRFVHPEQNRLLTPRECARIQTFPDNFRFFGSLVTQYYLIGNAVPPLLSSFIAGAANAVLKNLEMMNATSEDMKAVA